MVSVLPFYQNVNQMLEKLQTPIAILNGTKTLSGPEETLYNLLKSKELYLIDNLFNEPENLLQLKTLQIKTIIIQTTGVNSTAINKAVEFFNQINYVPQIIILIYPEYLWKAVCKFIKLNPTTKVYEYGDFGFKSKNFFG